MVLGFGAFLFIIHPKRGSWLELIFSFIVQTFLSNCSLSIDYRSYITIIKELSGNERSD